MGRRSRIRRPEHFVITDAVNDGASTLEMDVGAHVCEPPTDSRSNGAGDWTCALCGRAWRRRVTSEGSTFRPRRSGERTSYAIWEPAEEGGTSSLADTPFREP
jgi:hypothetical protein